MPISKDEFNKGRSGDPIINKIQYFLESNKEKAFTEDEILRLLYPDHTAWPADHNGFHSAALILAHAGKIEEKYVTTVGADTEVYFKAK